MNTEEPQTVRPFIFRERADLDEFLEEDPMWGDLYDLYLSLRRDAVYAVPPTDATATLKEACAFCTRVLLDKHPEEDVQKNYINSLNDIENVNKDICLSLAYAVLKLVHNPPVGVKRFVRELDFFLKKTKYGV